MGWEEGYLYVVWIGTFGQVDFGGLDNLPESLDWLRHDHLFQFVCFRRDAQRREEHQGEREGAPKQRRRHRKVSVKSEGLYNYILSSPGKKLVTHLDRLKYQVPKKTPPDVTKLSTEK